MTEQNLTSASDTQWGANKFQIEHHEVVIVGCADSRIGRFAAAQVLKGQRTDISPDGLIARKIPGRPSKLDEVHRDALRRIIESGPIPAVHGVVRWRLVDLVANGCSRSSASRCRPGRLSSLIATVKPTEPRLRWRIASGLC